MKSLKTKVIMSAIVLVFALIATIGSTYAWFTVSNQVEVTSFDINVESSEALLVKVYQGETDTGFTYGTYGWTLADFSNSVDIIDQPTLAGVPTGTSIYASGGSDDISAALLSPVTALGGETSNDTAYTTLSVTSLRKPSATFLTGAASGRALTAFTDTIANSPTGGYIELKFWLLKPSGDNTNITFDYTIASNTEAVYEEAIWFGTWNGTSQYVFGEDLDLDFNWVDPMPGFDDTALSTYNAIEGTGAATALAAATGTVNSTVITTLPTANVPELVTVYIWAEGWDADTVNAIMGANFAITLKFTLVVA